MQWRKFEQGTAPEGDVFLLYVEGNVFFTRIINKKFVMKMSYADAVAAERGSSDVDVTLYRWADRGVTPMWAHFHKPAVMR